MRRCRCRRAKDRVHGRLGLPRWGCVARGPEGFEMALAVGGFAEAFVVVVNINILVGVQVGILLEPAAVVGTRRGSRGRSAATASATISAMTATDALLLALRSH
ncbi:hypothetical protein CAUPRSCDRAFT_13011 [Caulochytrium protostelioides]|uniref:Uncharacterized protein n=1 Tax=Caulochytrium protostelioides TaxID=1555241 RepID=A0A4P9WVS5_9FUNG|nr:hypothetical protein CAUPRSCDRAFT_13011 [Caulochytrium protostelioides]